MNQTRMVYCQLVTFRDSLALRMILAAVCVLASSEWTTSGHLRAQPPGMTTAKGDHVTITSDFATTELLREYCAAFDAAVPQWENFFGFDPGTLATWRVDAFLMEQPDRFRREGLLPLHLRFPYGYAIGGNLWVNRQQSDYYTRHLLLHEGVHSLAIERFGGTGPSWYGEGTAELLGVHRGTGADVIVNVVPETRDAAPYWGRFKLLAQRRSENAIPTIDAVLGYPPDLEGDVESYGWSWCAAMLFDRYPEYRQTFLNAANEAKNRSKAFTVSFKQSLSDQWPIVQARWRILTATIDYGFDWQRERVELSTSDPLSDGREIEIGVRADQGWQSAGVRYSPGTRLILSPSGRCTIADEPKPWISEPAGVTIHYANGRPLGQLLVCVLPNATTETDQLQPTEVLSVDSETEIRIKKHSWLLFRVNDALGELGDNRGGYSVRIRQR